QAADSRAARGQLGRRAGDRPLHRAVVVGGAVLLLQPPAQRFGAPLRGRAEALRQTIERLHQDLGGTEAAQLPRHVAVVVVLAAPDVVADRVAHQAERRADLLDVLPRLVDGIGGLGARLAPKLPDRIVDLPGDHPPDPRTDRLPVEQAVGVRVEALAVAAPHSLAWDPGGADGPGGGDCGGLIARG